MGGDSGIEGPEDSEGAEETGDIISIPCGDPLWMSGFSLESGVLVKLLKDVVSLSVLVGGRTGKTHFVLLSRH